jgi:hypothetical protein
MSERAAIWRRVAGLTVATIVTAASVGCDDDSRATGLQTLQPSLAGDTISGTGQLAELQQRRASWVARKIDDYRFQLAISCFCGSEITRPVVIQVRQGAVTSVVDVQTNKPVTNKSLYPTITALFDAAIAERSRGGSVSVAYDRVIGIPARLEVGTVANDAGVLYFISDFVASS